MTNRFDKVVTMQEALSHFRDGMTLLAGGFGGVGNPPTLIQGILDLGVRDLTLISNDTAFPHIGIGKLVTEKRVKKVIASHIGSNPNAGAQMTAGELEVEFCPQGILAERVRAGGVGLGGILSDVGIGTIAEKGKQKVVLDGKEFLLETPLTAEVAIVHAKKADRFGNLVYDTSARNFNPLVAMAGDITIVEADEIVEVGELNPEEIVTPGVFVNYIVQSEGVNWQWAWEK
ncbi:MULTISPECIES: 3-oxoacid CoA-transferase subunit A [Brevibacillus]|jgi:acetate CoA/acetoacetate CoA-transferase alpha subunit|uniref:Acyl CoA:acetate/3-ketoacid CoA transferase subunit alpha n=1 Tax=Brevibacillus parabrevis TaxID=54914 RepID=A0A4Y3PX11_BREPA|nr:MULTISPECIES: CoA transferase subunit A [Brevibacillus]KZE52780.1 CoA-transferase [Brevibacillus parabrevis]MBU8711774.1 CoA transferase subunit A [Brevibacillus parabrevis]MDH6348841.1 acetate CoA/acetoacetate CoA-transferase alpha subunit [Brevibacillus sp. 1238]NRQ51792.1 CoA transferase subunit A [Brevibacillus sp. HD1.4A]RNB93437.1 CoA transferase subunit A [Brevibacillus parabrevis]